MSHDPDHDPETTVYSLIGQEGFARLAAAFYRKIPQDDLLGPMYPADDFPGAEDRLRKFLVFRFGGPPDYIVERGHPALRMRHAPFEIDQAARDRWYALMDAAVTEAELPEPAATVLRQFFAHTASFLVNRLG